MNLLKNKIGHFEKLSRCFSEYSTMMRSPMSHREIRNRHVKNQIQTKMRNFLEQTDNNQDENEILNNLKLASTPETNNFTDKNNLLGQEKLLEYNQLVSSIKTLTLVETRSEFVKSLRLVDLQCCKLLGVLPPSKILYLLHLFASTGHTVTPLKLYKSSLLALHKYLQNDKLLIGQKLQLLFFQGLSKKLATTYIKYLLNLLPPLRYFTLMEKTVVAHTTYKCNVALGDEDRRTLEEVLEKNATRVIKDPMILCTICKAINLAGPSDDLSLENLSREIIDKRSVWDMTVVAHVLGVYANANEKNSNAIDQLFRSSITHISSGRETLISRPVRIKDVDKILWALSKLDYTLRDSDKQVLLSFVVRRYKEFEENPCLLVNTLLSLWILRCEAHNVVKKCLANGVFERVKNGRERWKAVARLHLLLSCIKIESPATKLPDELFRIRRVEMQIRKSVKCLYGIMDELKKELDVQKAKIDCPIDGIYIAGVSFRSNNNSIHLDCLDETICFRKTSVPNGLTSLKIRLLKKIGIHSVLIPQDRSTDIKFVASTIAKSLKTHPSSQRNMLNRRKKRTNDKIVK